MTKYTISMDYKEFEKLKNYEEELKNLKKELSECVSYMQQGVPVIIHTKKLNKIALRYIPIEIEPNEVIVNE